MGKEFETTENNPTDLNLQGTFIFVMKGMLDPFKFSEIKLKLNVHS